jgi:hypothetical protein
MYVCMYVCVCMYMYMYMSMYMYMYMCMCMYMYMYLYMYMYMYMYMYVRMYVCMYVYIYIHIIWGFRNMGVPPNSFIYIHVKRFFHEINHPAIGVPRFGWCPPSTLMFSSNPSTFLWLHPYVPDHF